jgi:hypothetical protein
MKKFFLPLALIAAFAACSHEASNSVVVNADPVLSGGGAGPYATGLKIPPNFKPTNVKEAPKLRVGETLPSAFDWRTKAELMPIRSQGGCGSCWSYSSVATFEDVRRIFKGGKEDLSEQYLVSCNNEGWGCNGGFFAYNYMMKPKGSILEIDYPYTGTDSQCKSGLSYKWAIKNWAYLPGGDNAGNDVEGIKRALMTYGPMGVGVAVNDQFQNYRGGVFQDTGFRELNHAVNIVGWNDAEGGYWIMRNSWGTGWGENGYMRIRYGANGIGAWANYVVAEDSDPNPPPPPPPGPDPKPTPEPDPGCKPQPFAYTGYPDVISVRAGQRIVMGTKGRPQTSYSWVADPAFDNNGKPATAQINYVPRITKRLTVFATTKCGTAFHGTTVHVLPAVKAHGKLGKELQ